MKQIEVIKWLHWLWIHWKHLCESPAAD